MTLRQFITSDFWQTYKEVYAKDIDYLTSLNFDDDELELILAGQISVSGVFDLLNDALFSYETIHKSDCSAALEALDNIYETFRKDLDTLYLFDFIDQMIFRKEG